MWYAVLVSEILFYAIFMHELKRKDFFKYIIIFTIATIVVLFLEKIKLLAYLSFVVITLIGMAIIHNNKSSNILKVLIMLIYKLAIELIFTYIIYLIEKDVLFTSLMVSGFKICITMMISRLIYKLDSKVDTLWEKNNFYIRYITTIFLMIYIVATCIYLIKYWL